LWGQIYVGGVNPKKKKPGRRRNVRRSGLQGEGDLISSSFHLLNFFEEEGAICWFRGEGVSFNRDIRYLGEKKRGSWMFGATARRGGLFVNIENENY